MNGIRPAAAQSEDGFALVAALLVAALLAMVVSASLVVALAASASADADADAASARHAAEDGLASALESLRWGWPIPQSGTAGLPDACTRWSATVTEVDPASPGFAAAAAIAGVQVPLSSVVVVEVVVDGCFHDARCHLTALGVVSPDALPRGVAVVGDATIGGRLDLAGCGLYVGGDVMGREHVEVEDTGGGAIGPPADMAWPGIYGSALVHARGAIWVAGAEVHSSAGAAIDDDDRHTGGGPPEWLVAPRSGALLAGLRSHAEAVSGVAFVAPVLRVDLLPFAGGGSAGPAAGEGSIIALPSQPGAPVVVSGERPGSPVASPLTIIVDGDCRVEPSAPQQRVCFSGSLVVSGRLVVAGRCQITGSVSAGSLEVDGHLRVDVPVENCRLGQEYAPGASNVEIVSWQE